MSNKEALSIMSGLAPFLFFVVSVGLLAAKSGEQLGAGQLDSYSVAIIGMLMAIYLKLPHQEK